MDVSMQRRSSSTFHCSISVRFERTFPTAPFTHRLYPACSNWSIGRTAEEAEEILRYDSPTGRRRSQWASPGFKQCKFFERVTLGGARWTIAQGVGGFDPTVNVIRLRRPFCWSALHDRGRSQFACSCCLKVFLFRFPDLLGLRSLALGSSFQSHFCNVLHCEKDGFV